MDKHYFILCNDCIDPEEVTALYDARYGPQDLQEGDLAALACCDWEDRFLDAQLFLCDNCGRKIAVAPSSQWFVDLHRKQQELA